MNPVSEISISVHREEGSGTGTTRYEHSEGLIFGVEKDAYVGIGKGAK